MDTENQTTQIREDSVVREGDGGALNTVRDQHVSGLAYFGMDDSWIKVHRKLQNHWLFENPNYTNIWLVMLFNAQWETRKRVRDGMIVEVQRGELVMSYKTIALRSYTTEKMVRNFIMHAKKDGMIEAKQGTKTAHLTIINYNKLQGHEDETGRDSGAIRAQSGRDKGAIIRSKEVKKERIEQQIDSVSMRSRAFTRPTLQEILGYFIELGSTADEANKFFDHYTANGWKVGKNAMKDWKATARNWNRNSNNYNKPLGRTNGTGQKGDRGRYDSLEYANQLAQLGNRGLPSTPVKPTYLAINPVARPAPISGYIDSPRTSGSDTDET
jgi:hypothetical protein